MKTNQISLSEYAARVSPEGFRKNRKNPEEPLTQQAIKYRIKMGMELPDVIESKKIGKVHVLTVNVNF